MMNDDTFEGIHLNRSAKEADTAAKCAEERYSRIYTALSCSKCSGIYRNIAHLLYFLL